mmetsp:Transcript_16212/g.43676  ORF Transcript_16212/g.43676 Transcript_16212/m.43676 type:complete len:678 (+) Transcript_16212:69-2102(+)
MAASVNFRCRGLRAVRSCRCIGSVAPVAAPAVAPVLKERSVASAATAPRASGAAAIASLLRWKASTDRSQLVAAATAAVTAAAALAATAAACHGHEVRCESASSIQGPKASGVVRCEAVLRQGSDSSIVILNVEKDRPGLLAETTELLKHHKLDIRDAKISTKGDTDKAQHIYTVQDKSSGKGLTSEKLEEIRKALEKLGAVECTAKAWPMYTRAEVARHTTMETGIWVSYKNGVYDITEFVANHPGGKDKIMLAAGKSIEPFWRIYQQHEGRGTAVSQLERMRIGDLADPQPLAERGDCPYGADPNDRHPGLIYHNNKPCNAEVPCELMMDNWLTPNPVWFIRHHHPVPIVDPSKYRLTIEGEGAKQVTLTLEDIKSRFLKREVVTTIQCGGNRRSELDKIEKTSGIPWGAGAMSNAKWGGVYLREVLMHCADVNFEGIEWNGVKHVVCYGADDMQASIPIEKALSPFGDVLLAYEMNGEPLPAEHGSPVRLIAPGVVGVRNVKWVDRVRTSREEAEGPWQRGIAYKGFSPMQKDCSGVDVEKILSMQEMPVQSAIMSPKEGSTVELDDIEVKGWAWSGGGRGIVRVDVSIDEGKTWTTAELGEGSTQNPSRAWAWTFWEASIPVPDDLRGKEVQILCRATDSSYSTQPERAAPIWNLRGLNCNCWHHVKVQHSDE